MKNFRIHDKKKIAALLITGAVLLLSSCKQDSDTPKDFFSYWSSEAFVTEHSINSAHRADTAGIQCADSSSEAVVMLKVYNPKSFQLALPTAHEPLGIVEFKALSVQPVAGTDYTLSQLDPKNLKLTYSKSFLQKYEQGKGNLSPVITIKAKDGRVFSQTYTFTLKSNSPPPKPEVILARTNESTSHYVVCLKFDSAEMTRTVTTGSGSVPIHKDIASITINGSTYSLSYKEDNNGFQKPSETFPTGSFIEQGNVVQLNASYPAVPSGGWVLYLKTDVDVESIHSKKLYTITLHDKEGVVSDGITAELKEKFKVQFDAKNGTPAPNPQYIENGGKVEEPSVSYTGFNLVGWYTEDSYTNKWDFDNNTVTSNITLYAQWTASDNTQYKVKHYKQNIGDDGYPATPSHTDNLQGTTGADASVTLKNYPGFEAGEYTPASIAPDGSTVVEVRYKRRTYSVEFGVNGSNGNIAVTSVTGGVAGGSPLTVKYEGTVAFRATPADENSYKVGDWTCTPSEGFSVASGQKTASLTVTKDTSVSVSFVPLSNLNLTKLEIHGMDASGGSVTLPYTKSQVTKGNISLEFSGHSVVPFNVTPSLPLNLTPGTTTSVTINVAASPGNYAAWSKTVSITRKKNSVANLKSFKLNGETKTAPFASEYTVASDKAEVTGFSFDSDSEGATASVTPSGSVTIPAESEKTFTITVKAQDGTTNNIRFTVKRQKYTVRFNVADGEGTLRGSYGSQNPTAQNGGGTQTLTNVPHGSTVSFDAIPGNGWELYTWTGVSSSSTGASLTVDGDKNVSVKFKKKEYQVKFSVVGGDGGELKGTYNGSTKTARGNTEETFTVQHGDTVNFTGTADAGWDIEDWTISSGNFSSGGGTGTTAALTVTDDTTVKVKFKPGELNLAGGGPDAWKRLKEEAEKPKGAHTITISGEIKATNDSGNNGKITPARDLTIKGNGSSAVLNANNLSSIFDVRKTLTLENIKLKNGKADQGGGAYVSGTLVMKDSSSIESCTASDKGGGVYVNGTFKMSGSAKVDTDNDVYLASGKSIGVTGALTHEPAARITPDSYTDGRVLATDNAEKSNFTVTPKNGNEYWRYKKKDGVVKFVRGKLTVRIGTIISIEEHDGATDAEYFWTMKVDNEAHTLPRNKAWKPAKQGKTYNINKSKEIFVNLVASKTVVLYFKIEEKDYSGDDLIVETTRDCTYDPANDRWTFKGQDLYCNYPEGSFRLEFHNTSKGEVDVMCYVKWEDE